MNKHVDDIVFFFSCSGSPSNILIYQNLQGNKDMVVYHEKQYLSLEGTQRLLTFFFPSIISDYTLFHLLYRISIKIQQHLVFHEL